MGVYDYIIRFPFVLCHYLFVEDSYNILESSPDPGGLPFRFLIKSVITVSFFLLAFVGIIKIINSLKGSE